MVVNPVHPEKALTSIVVTLAGILNVVKPVHPEKALLPIVVTPGMLSVVRLVQFAKHDSGMDVIVPGSETEVKPEQPL
jgi:hypothetical protein